MIFHTCWDSSLIGGYFPCRWLSSRLRLSSAIVFLVIMAEEIEVRAVDTVKVLDFVDMDDEGDCRRAVGNSFCKTAWIVSGQLAPGEISSTSQEAKF